MMVLRIVAMPALFGFGAAGGPARNIGGGKAAPVGRRH